MRRATKRQSLHRIFHAGKKANKSLTLVGASSRYAISLFGACTMSVIMTRSAPLSMQVDAFVWIFNFPTSGTCSSKSNLSWSRFDGGTLRNALNENGCKEKGVTNISMWLDWHHISHTPVHRKRYVRVVPRKGSLFIGFFTREKRSIKASLSSAQATGIPTRYLRHVQCH